MKHALFALAAITAMSLPIVYAVAVRWSASSAEVTRIAFGSCNQAWALYQPMWDAILEARPDLWVWIGDAVYADTADAGVIRKHYQQQKAREDYRRLLREVPVIGVWDDHDYGINDGDKTYPVKAESQQAFLDFIGEPADSPRRARAGIYASHSYGEPGRRLKIILLDTRYHRDPPAPGADLLGEEQWRWLESELTEPAADLVLLVSSIVVIPRPQPGESWSRYPASAQRFSEIIKRTPVPLVLLSGDLHLAELSRFESPELRWPVYELTSSGLTHSASNSAGYPNSFRVGKLFTQLNFGLVSIDWGRKRVKVTLEIRDVENRVQVADTVTFTKAAGGEPR